MRAARLPILFLLVAVATLVLVSAERTWRETVPFTGVTLADATGGVAVKSVEHGSPAESAGLQPGDVITEICGHVVRAVLPAQDLLAQAPPERPLGLALQRDGVTLSLRVRPAPVTSWHPERVAGTFVALLFWLAAAAAMTRPKRPYATAVYVAWCTAGALVLGVSWSARGAGLDWALFWIDRVARLAWPALWVHLALSLRRETRPSRRALPLVYAPAAGLLLAELHLALFGGAFRADDPLRVVEWLRGGLELGWIVLGLAGGFAVLTYMAFRAVAAEERTRARWFLAGTGLGIVPFALLAAVPTIAGVDTSRVGWVSLPFLGLLPLIFTGAVLDYRLMDLSLFARRAVTGLATLGFSLLLFLGLLQLLGAILPVMMHPFGLVPPLIAAIVTAALAPAIRAGSRDLVGRVFYRRRYNFRRALARVARDLNAERDLPRLTAVLELRIAEALSAGVARVLLAGIDGELRVPSEDDRVLRDVLTPAMRAALERGELLTLALLADAPERLPELNAEGVQVLVPLRVERRLIAVVAAGPSARGTLLDSDDIDLLKSIAGHAAAAVAGALHLAELREQVQLVRRLQARTESLIESSPIGLAVIEREGLVRDWNPSVAELLGVPRSEALGRPFAELLPLPLRTLVRDYLAAGDGQGARAYRLRVGAPRFDDRPGERLVDVSISALRGPDGSEGVLLTIDDVTERVQLEQKLIQQDRLASVGLLAAGVAHEVNTPLTGISSYAQLLLDESPADDPRRDLLEKIVQQAGRASNIARGLLRFSRPTPVDAVAFGPVDCRELIDETIGLLGPQIRKSRARVELRPATLPAFALGDRTRLQQVVINLLLNALDAVRSGGRVVVRTGGVPDRTVWIEVEDDGVGIPEEFRGRIFDPFFTTKKPGHGTGLGLSICYGIVREHGGTLTVDSEPGRGTTMRVELPGAGAAQPEPAPRAEARRAV